MAAIFGNLRYDVLSPDQRVLTFKERVLKRWDQFLQAIDVFACCGLSLCGSGVQWDIVDRERRFARDVAEEHGYIYDNGHLDSLTVLIREHESSFGYRLDPPSAVTPVVRQPSVPVVPPTALVAVGNVAGVGSGVAGRTGLVAVNVQRRRRCHVAAPIVAKLVAEMRAEIGFMCQRCSHPTVDHLLEHCNANYQAAQWTALRIMKDRKMHPEQCQLYLKPTLIHYFSAEQFSHGFGGYTGNLGGVRPPSRMAEL